MISVKKLIMRIPIDRIVQIMIVITMPIALVTAYQTHKQASCQAHYNEINNQRTQALNEYSTSERNARTNLLLAQGELWKAASMHPSTPGHPSPEVTTAFSYLLTSQDDFSRAVIALDTSLKQHPVPPPPSQLCK